MGLIIGVMFLGVFSVVALLLVAFGSGASQQAKQVHATLDSALATDRLEEQDEYVNLRKSERLSSIPWLDRKLLQFELSPRLQALLYQADLKWPVGGLLAGCGLLFSVGAYLADVRFDSFYLSVPVGLLLGSLPFVWIFRKRSKRLDLFQQGLPEALDVMVSALRAGHGLVAALGSVAR